jgi:hypothetical protein
VNDLGIAVTAYCSNFHLNMLEILKLFFDNQLHLLQYRYYNIHTLHSVRARRFLSWIKKVINREIRRRLHLTDFFMLLSLNLAKAITQFVKGSYKNIIDSYKHIA